VNDERGAAKPGFGACTYLAQSIHMKRDIMKYYVAVQPEESTPLALKLVTAKDPDL
jgi:hypothetical protein